MGKMNKMLATFGISIAIAVGLAFYLKNNPITILGLVIPMSWAVVGILITGFFAAYGISKSKKKYFR